MTEILKRTRAAIAKVFGDIIDSNPKERKRIIEASTYEGADDPGGWAPRSAVVIHTEQGIPNSETWQLMDKWSKVSDLLGTHYCEPINPAVIAVYEV